MKKLMSIFGLLLFISTMTFAQEVRGIETKRVKDDNGNYGWELYNKNSISVSVDIELWYKGHSYTERNHNGFITLEYQEDTKIVETKSIVLKAGEQYVFKPVYFRKNGDSNQWAVSISDSYIGNRYRYTDAVENYYIKYQAHKLL